MSVTYRAVLKGFAATLSNTPSPLFGRTRPSRSSRPTAWSRPTPSRAGEQPAPPWGLDRIDQRDLPLDQTYHYDHTGAGVTAYIIDTGMRITHEEFEGRASYGYDFVRRRRDARTATATGPTSAGTVGGKTYGVAKERRPGRDARAQLRRPRQLVARHRRRSTGRSINMDGPSVANLSLGGLAAARFDMAIHRAVDAGLTVVVSAGNSAPDACLQSPARAPRAITVARDRHDRRPRVVLQLRPVRRHLRARASASCRPGIASDTATATLSGTSMSAPHVTGVAALFLEQQPDSDAEAGPCASGAPGDAGQGHRHR